ncbi:tubulin-folding cofactor b [Moesziomyces antarcticus]|uniref:Related to Tubulin-specific chaperone B n=1 Tax=Pseudozyma antarctica TaxID=84753 RepID=A0A5C3FH82_PSEA2|nr:tubulin-folding cofactor b [Moesziomyces antarcticus]GAK62511.1 tubulin-folding cofactor b [Moesziomyces antarcticus]SPO43065.1 related to Tubulin-specific chaperone B [Moesziomyces antarcticus]
MSVVNVFIHAPSTLVSAERRVPSTIPLHDLKYRLESIVGVPPSHQVLEIHSSRTDHEQQQQLAGPGPFAASVRSTLVAAVPPNSDVESRSLEELGVVDGMAIKVLDTRPKELIQTFTDESLVDKYVMDDDTYAARRDTVLAFKQRNKLGRFDPSKDASSSAGDTEDLPTELTVGARCQVDLLSGTGTTGANQRKGTIRFVGSTKFATGAWVGVEYDEPVGKNDGSVAGERYFTCKPNFGSFVRPDKVQVGDFPADDFDLDLDDDEEM